MHALLAAMLLQPATVNLSRGGPGDSSFRFWGVADTFVDSTTPDRNYGRDPLLSAGPGKVVLIKFSDLARVLGPNQKVESARLLLHLEIGSNPQLAGVYLLRRGWGEGPAKRGISMIPIPIESGAIAPSMAATWNQNFGGKPGSNWQSPGGRGGSDREVLRDVTLVVQDQTAILEGLGPAVQGWLDRPDTNFGLAIETKGAVDFSSSEAAEFAPVLSIQTAPSSPKEGVNLLVSGVELSAPFGGAWPATGTAVEWVASIKTLGGDSGGKRVDWIQGEKVIASAELPAAKVGEAQTARATVPWLSASSARKGVITVRVSSFSGLDANPADDAYTFSPQGMSYRLVVNQMVSDQFTKWLNDHGLHSVDALGNKIDGFFNEEALRQSVFSFAPDGSKAVVYHQVSGAGDLTGKNVVVIDAAMMEALSSPTGFRSLVRSVGLAVGLVDLSLQNWRRESGVLEDAFPGLMGGGDTRNDGEFPAILGFPNEPWFDPSTQLIPMRPTDLLSATDVAILDAKTVDPSATPMSLIAKQTVLRLLGPDNQLLKGALLRAYSLDREGKRSEEAVFALGSTESGISVLQNRNGATPFVVQSPDLGGMAMVFEVERAGMKDYGTLKAWQLIDATARGNQDAAIIPLRLMLPEVPIAAETNFAKGKLVTGTTAATLASLAAATDENLGSIVVIQAGKSIEIDLGRDRFVGAVALNFMGKLPNGFKIYLRETGQPESAARMWFTDINPQRSFALRGKPVGDTRQLTVTGKSETARFVRIEVPAGAGDCELAEVYVRAAVPPN